MKPKSYPLPIRWLHWLMAFGFFLMWSSGYLMSHLVTEDSILEGLLFSLHISSGVSLLFLLLIRLLLRLISNLPGPLPQHPRWQRKAAGLGHFSLYILPLLVIAIGWAETDFGGHGVRWFGLAMPKLFPTLETLAGISLETVTETLHRWLAYLMLTVTLIHIGAVIQHERYERGSVLPRMLPDKPY
ncbi:MAG: cytochrome b/b6 domain-containing protein [Chromatiales bacterium]|nr:cytochrome b/b6 domain-containing protein [Chromatiales bacterium]